MRKNQRIDTLISKPLEMTTPSAETKRIIKKTKKSIKPSRLIKLNIIKLS